jgi:CheY-like chemotaxis protein
LQFPSIVIEEAAEGNEALRKVDTFFPDLIFMDINLPGENGLLLTQRVKRIIPRLSLAFSQVMILGNTESLHSNVGSITLLLRAHGRRLRHWSNPFHRIWITTLQTD